MYTGKELILRVTTLESNKGQLEGVPKNPRRWTSDEVDVLCNSIIETPELMDARPLLVVKRNRKYVVLGGNMRLEAIRRLGWESCKCYEFCGMSADKMKEVALKDNSSFGNWDADELANKWDELPLEDWGVHVGGIEIAGKDIVNTELDIEDWSEDMVMKFKFTPEQAGLVHDYFKGKEPREEILRLVGYE